MAYPRARSCNSELERGMIDGTYKQINRDRGGALVEANAAIARAQLGRRLYGITEAQWQVMPDCSDVLRTPYTVYSPDPEMYPGVW